MHCFAWKKVTRGLEKLTTFIFKLIENIYDNALLVGAGILLLHLMFCVGMWATSKKIGIPKTHSLIPVIRNSYLFGLCWSNKIFKMQAILTIPEFLSLCICMVMFLKNGNIAVAPTLVFLSVIILNAIIHIILYYKFGRYLGRRKVFSFALGIFTPVILPWLGCGKGKYRSDI